MGYEVRLESCYNSGFNQKNCVFLSSDIFCIVTLYSFYC